MTKELYRHPRFPAAEPQTKDEWEETFTDGGYYDEEQAQMMCGLIHVTTVDKPESRILGKLER